MDSSIFKAFVKHASGGPDTPNDYIAMKLAAMKMFPKLATGLLGHATELAGLGVLARPSVNHLRGKEMSERSKAVHEAAGLGMLAAPSAYHLGKGLLEKAKPLAQQATHILTRH